MKYGAGKPIHVRTWFDNNEGAKLSVADQGMGIAEEDQARIFMQFERAVSGYAITGLGLGLYISNEIVKMHKGHIVVQSELGKGATFIFSLPKS
jgi:signal transduction histidine kinase